MKHVITAAAAATLSLSVLTGCGTDGDMPMDHGSHMPGMGGAATDKTTPKPGANANQADIDFVTMMIPHHQQALMMVRMATGRPQSAKFRTLLRGIQQAQTPEIREMQTWRTSWTGSSSPMGGMSGMDHMHGDGMMTMAEMRRLRTAPDAGYEKLWLRMMIKHHRGAIVAARTEITDGRNPKAVALARSIVTSQTAEIATMRRMIQG